jgi:hypothetical protein
MNDLIPAVLTSNFKQQWDEFVDTSPQGSIFCKSWWLDIVSPKYEIFVLNNSGRIIGGIPLTYKSIFGFEVIAMPKLTQTLGILIEPINSKYVKKISKEKEIIAALVKSIPPVLHFSQNFHYNFTNWLPFHWERHKATVRYTYVFEDLSDLRKLFEGMRENIKTDIRKAEKLGLKISQDLTINDFLGIYKKTFERQSKQAPFTDEFLIKLDRELEKRSARKMFFAVDDRNRIHSAVYMIWDNKSAYYLMGGGDPELRNSGANSLALWNAIQFASQVTKRFDFEGSIIQNVESYFRSFGAEQKQYLRIWKNGNRLLDIAMLFKGQ